MKHNEVEHEIARRKFWCEVYLKRAEDFHRSSEYKVNCANEALEIYDKKFKTLPEAIEIGLASSEEKIDIKGHVNLQS